MNRTSAYKVTTDDSWYPAYEVYASSKRLVEVVYHGDISPPNRYPVYRVSVRGRDDFGMERDFISENEAIRMFMAVIQMDVVNQDELNRLGFMLI